MARTPASSRFQDLAVTRGEAVVAPAGKSGPKVVRAKAASPNGSPLGAKRDVALGHPLRRRET